MELRDVIRSLRRHWKVGVSILLLSVVVLGAFLVTRKQTQQPTKYRASVQVLIPARDEKGNLPAGVPPVLLQGQEALALAPATTGAALASLPPAQRGDVRFGVSKSAKGDIVFLTATTGDVSTARAAADALASAYVNARRHTVASGTTGEQQSARRALEVLHRRLDQVEGQMRATNTPMGPIVPNAKDGSPPVLLLPPGLSTDSVLLAYERNTLYNKIQQTQVDYATLATRALTPSSYASIVERPAPQRITPAPPSPLLPALAILGIGLVLAIAVPTLMDRLDHSIKDSRSAAGAFGAPVLSVIPAAPKGEEAALAPPGTPRDAAFRKLAATSVATDRLPAAIMVTAPVGRLHDSVAANFAAALASLGLRVALIATAPRQSWFLDASQQPRAHDNPDGGEEHADDPLGPGDADAVTSPPLTPVDVLPGEPDAPARTLTRPARFTLPDLLARAHAGTLNGEIRVNLVKTDVANLLVIPPGDSDELDPSLDGLPPLLDALSKEQIDVTVIAGPALLEDANATIFAWSTRSVLWAAELGEVTDAEAREGASRLVLAGVDPFGVALVGRQA